MRIAYGHTRLVLLVGNKAIKIGRIRPIRTVLRICILPFSQARRTHFKEKYGAHFLEAFIHDVCAGLYANRHEHAYFCKTRDLRLAPVEASFFYGWIILQTRGAPLNDADTILMPKELATITKREQLAKMPNGRIVIVDYGESGILKFIASTP